MNAYKKTSEDEVYLIRLLVLSPLLLDLVADDAVVLGRVVLTAHVLTTRAMTGETVLGILQIDMRGIVRDAGRALATDGTQQTDYHHHEDDEDHGLHDRRELLGLGFRMFWRIGRHNPVIVAYGHWISIFIIREVPSGMYETECTASRERVSWATAAEDERRRYPGIGKDLFE